MGIYDVNYFWPEEALPRPIACHDSTDLGRNYARQRKGETFNLWLHMELLTLFRKNSSRFLYQLLKDINALLTCHDLVFPGRYL